MKILFGALAYHQHIQNVAAALYETDCLGAFVTGAVDNYEAAWAKAGRRFIACAFPGLHHQMLRRRINGIPDSLIKKDCLWEYMRIIASQLRLNLLKQDWLWENSELGLDRKCAGLIQRPEFNAFVGVEHSSLQTINVAKVFGKKTIVMFTSPHHLFYKKWVEPEYQKYSELSTPVTRRLDELAIARDQRRDQEANLADCLLTNSSLTSRSLKEAGFDPRKILTVPLGAPDALDENGLKHDVSPTFRFMYAGPLSVRKGAHHLLEVWRRLSLGSGAELYLYGVPILPKQFTVQLPPNVFFKPTVSQSELFPAYQQASLLVFPTLCDGFGMVVLEAMANGLPVLLTSNAGAADLVKEGENGFVISPGDTEALASRMEWCFKHPEILLAMRKNALATARHYSWKRFRNTLVEQLTMAGFNK